MSTNWQRRLAQIFRPVRRSSSARGTRSRLRLEHLETRLTPTTGSWDFSFGSSAKVTTGFNLGGYNDDDASATAVQADGKIVVVGSAEGTTTGGSDFAI